MERGTARKREGGREEKIWEDGRRGYGGGGDGVFLSVESSE